jgi:hypothetical protein
MKMIKNFSKPESKCWSGSLLKSTKTPAMDVGDVQEELSHCEIDSCTVAEDGQLIYRSKIYQWHDGTYHTEKET